MATDVSSGAQSSNGVSADTVIKKGVGRLVRVSVTTAGAAGAVYDSATVAGAGASNLIAVVPATVGVYFLDWPVLNGITYVPGSAQVVSISYT
jgi:hypothetical protein